MSYADDDILGINFNVLIVMIENQINIQNRFTMRVNFNLKSLANVGSKKSQIWLTTTINGKRVRAYTGLLIEQEYWKRTTRSEMGEWRSFRWESIVKVF